MREHITKLSTPTLQDRSLILLVSSRLEEFKDFGSIVEKVQKNNIETFKWLFLLSNKYGNR